jgi:DNA polymerase-3 subunit beta
LNQSLQANEKADGGNFEIDFKTGLDNDIYLAVNSRYILDFLSNIENSNFTLGFNDSGLPFTLESDNFMTIVMPIMI